MENTSLLDATLNQQVIEGNQNGMTIQEAFEQAFSKSKKRRKKFEKSYISLIQASAEFEEFMKTQGKEAVLENVKLETCMAWVQHLVQELNNSEDEIVFAICRLINIFGFLQEEMGSPSLQFFIQSLSYYFNHYCDNEDELD